MTRRNLQWMYLEIKTLTFRYIIRGVVFPAFCSLWDSDHYRFKNNVEPRHPVAHKVFAFRFVKGSYAVEKFHLQHLLNRNWEFPWQAEIQIHFCDRKWAPFFLAVLNVLEVEEVFGVSFFYKEAFLTCHTLECKKKLTQLDTNAKSVTNLSVIGNATTISTLY